MIIGDTFKLWVQFNRIVFIRGRLGGGKTLLAVAIADWMLRDGLVTRVWTNFPCRLSSYVEDLIDTVAILDEAWQWLDYRVVKQNRSHAYAAFLRKANAYLVMASARAVVRELMDLTVYRFLDLTHLGIPVWWYRARWVLDEKNGDVEYCNFFLVNPQKYFNLYPTRYVPVSDGHIPELLSATIEKLVGSVEEWDWGDGSKWVLKPRLSVARSATKSR